MQPKRARQLQIQTQIQTPQDVRRGLFQMCAEGLKYFLF